jgi:hypothetical protein
MVLLLVLIRLHLSKFPKMRNLGITFDFQDGVVHHSWWLTHFDFCFKTTEYVTAFEHVLPRNKQWVGFGKQNAGKVLLQSSAR